MTRIHAPQKSTHNAVAGDKHQSHRAAWHLNDSTRANNTELNRRRTLFATSVHQNQGSPTQTETQDSDILNPPTRPAHSPHCRIHQQIALPATNPIMTIAALCITLISVFVFMEWLRRLRGYGMTVPDTRNDDDGRRGRSGYDSPSPRTARMEDVVDSGCLGKRETPRTVDLERSFDEARGENGSANRATRSVEGRWGAEADELGTGFGFLHHEFLLELEMPGGVPRHPSPRRRHSGRRSPVVPETVVTVSDLLFPPWHPRYRGRRRHVVDRDE